MNTNFLPVPQELQTISLFSGGGGLDLGFSAAGYKLCASTDIDEYSCRTLRRNSGKKSIYSHTNVINEDIMRLSAKNIANDANLPANIDLIIGGPPCQAFSVFGRRKGLEDPRGNLVWEYLRIVEEVRPTAFLFENVDGIKTIHGGSLYDSIISKLSLNNEYVVSSYEYNVAEYGIPQYRKRIFFIGWRNGHTIPAMMPTHGTSNLLSCRKPYVTVGDVLIGMPKPDEKGLIPNHVGRQHSQRIVDRYESLEFGERDHKTRINKLHPSKPSFTIIVGSNAGGGKGHVHPFQPREVTPRESARLQTFPDWWEFDGHGRHVIRQVGNAVPPLFAALLAEHIKEHIFGIRSGCTYSDFVDLLELDYLKHVCDQRSI